MQGRQGSRDYTKGADQRATGICSASTVNSRFQKWVQAGMFARFWDMALQDYDELIGLDFDWISLDGSLYKVPLGGKKTVPNPTDRGKGGVNCSLLTAARGIPVGGVLNGANRHAMKLTESNLQSLPPALEAARDAHRAAGNKQHLFLDAGYDYNQVREVVAGLGYTAHIRPRDEEAQAKKRAKRPAAGAAPVGWSNVLIPGSTGFATCSPAGPQSPKTT